MNCARPFSTIQVVSELGWIVEIVLASRSPFTTCTRTTIIGRHEPGQLLRRPLGLGCL